MKIKYYNLKKWDKAKHWPDWEMLTFRKMDWAYVQWEDSNGKICFWHNSYYELQGDGTYIWLYQKDDT